ncbi:hypothetical protein [Cellulomonas gilvus]|uniref:Uncharacterized protein n=1 Tax=Cellulomonas gilvus (strain ATCC 13127 / NRRL B-14078) TaxID=593907 RepID=F8A7B7_CELGA|nr:hypothetical protein [Cellulomonas gilvus]AEI11175.1 hypothetical protein Celgi_0656 [Cellulomonas gilvus ATCC 13127]
MTLPDPARAPRRDDLPWLRRRPRPGPRATSASTGAVRTPAQASAPSAAAAPAAPARPLVAPDAPPARPLTGPGPEQASASLPAPGPGVSSLDLTPPSAPAAARPAAGRRPGTRRRRSAADGDPVLGWQPRRARADRPVLLTRERPTVVLTPVQSGVGALRITSIVSEQVGDLTLGALCTLADGSATLLDANRDMSAAPAGARSPVVSAAGRDLSVDLRQVRALRRLVVVAFSPTSAVVTWGGVVRVELVGGTRVDVPLEREPQAGALVALSVVNVDGSLVLRAEDELVPGALREVGQAYGSGLRWVDAWTPVV